MPLKVFDNFMDMKTLLLPDLSLIEIFTMLHTDEMMVLLCITGLGYKKSSVF